MKFYKVYPDGTTEKFAEIAQDSIRQCPHYIMAPEHYREDGSCRCDDLTHTEMKEWGYIWKEGRWA